MTSKPETLRTYAKIFEMPRRGMPTSEACKAAAAALRYQADAIEGNQATALLALRHADGCFEAALVEGWIEAINSGDIAAIRDLWERRLSMARDLFAAALNPEGASGEGNERKL